jgi:hypothetical protein
LHTIQTKTGVLINIPRREKGETTFEPVTLNEDDLDAEEEMVPIDIEGDAESIKAAKEEIDSIISKVRTSSRAINKQEPWRNISIRKKYNGGRKGYIG